MTISSLNPSINYVPNEYRANNPVVTANPWAGKTGNEVSLELQNDHNKKYDYLTALDNERAEMARTLSEKLANGTLERSDLDRYDQVNNQIMELKENMPFTGAEGDEFAAWLQYRQDQNGADFRHFESKLNEGGGTT